MRNWGRIFSDTLGGLILGILIGDGTGIRNYNDIDEKGSYVDYMK